MVRVPTYATYSRMIDDSIANRELLDLYTYQSMTGLKSQNYSGYGMSASTIVSLEAALAVNTNYMETNKIVQTDVNIIEQSINSIDTSIEEFNDLLISFAGLDLSNIQPDETGGELKLTDVDMTIYNGQTITANGIEYTIGGTGANAIANAGTPQELMENIANAIPDMTYDAEEEVIDFPLYTINGYSTILNTNGVELGDPHMPTEEQQQMLKEVQTFAFTTMMLLADTLNVSITGQYAFGGGEETEKPVDFPFSTLEEFQAVYDGYNLTYPDSTASVLTNRTLTNSATGGLTFDYAGGIENTATITSANAEGFLTDNMSANSQTAGTLTFSADKQTVNSTVGGAFNTYSEGDLMIIEGTAGNNGVYVVESVSADGKTVTLTAQDGTAPISDETFDSALNPDVAQFKSTFAQNSIISLDGMGEFGLNQQEVQVTGVSADGTELYIKVNPSTFPTGTTTIPDSDRWTVNSSGYYEGGNLSSEKFLSENQSIVFDITAADPAFEKMFRALGQIAQGNLVDMRTLDEPMLGVKDNEASADLVNNALDLIQEALFDPNANSTAANADFYSIQSKVNSSLIVLNYIEESQTAMKLNLENDIYSLKNVDQEEAAVKALLASTQLEASYAAMQNAMNVTLLDYLR